MTDSYSLSTMAAIGAPDPPCPPRLVGEVIETVQIPDGLFVDLLDWLQFNQEEVGELSLDVHSGLRIHVFLRNLASREEPVPGLEHLALMGVGQDDTLHLLHLLLYFLVFSYSIDKILLAFVGEITLDPSPPLVTELPINAFAVRRTIYAVTQEDHRIRVEGVPPPH